MVGHCRQKPPTQWPLEHALLLLQVSPLPLLSAQVQPPKQFWPAGLRAGRSDGARRVAGVSRVLPVRARHKPRGHAWLSL